MKKILSILFVVTVLFINIQKSIAASSPMGFNNALEQKKPLLVLIYATWADDAQTAVTNFNGLKKVYGDKFNYLLLDIAKPATKEYNAKFPIATDLPYLMMFKNKGSVMRFVQKDCVINNACVSKKVGIFGR